MLKQADRRAPGSGDEGFTLILLALLLVVLMAFTAIVIDIGAGYNYRRQDQSAADTAALAAAQDMPNDSLSVASAKSYANAALSSPLPNSAWNLCATDAGALAIRATNNNCISFNNARTRVRVRLPDQIYETTFGKVVGVDEIRHTAFAIAGIQQVGFGNVLPFGIPFGGGSGDGYSCLKSDSGNEEPCGNDSGNFGYIDFGWFGNEELGTAGGTANSRCGNGNQDGRVRNSIAVGVDHTLGVAPSIAPTTAADAPDACLAGGTEVPDNGYTRTGGADLVEYGLFSGSSFTDGGLPRFRRDNVIFPGTAWEATVKGYANIDSVPLWEYIPTTIDAGNGTGNRVPESCERTVWNNLSTLGGSIPTDVRTHLITEYPSNPQEWGLRLLRRCFSHYMGNDWTDLDSDGNGTISPEPRVAPGCPTNQPCPDPVFTTNRATETPEDLFDIQLSPRFGYVPEYWQLAADLDGTDRVTFRAFRAVYMQRSKFGTGGNEVVWDPGFTAPAIPSNRGFRELTGMVFHPNMLPGNLGSSTAPFDVGSNRFIRLVR